MLLLYIEQPSSLHFPFDFGHHEPSRQLRTFHGTFMDEWQFRTFYRTFTELSQTYGQMAITDIPQSIQGFTNVTELSWIIMVTGLKTRAIVGV